MLDSQFFRFFIVGTIGFVVDVSVLFLGLNVLGLDRYTARVISFLAAASTTWALNRQFTFKDADRSQPVRQWTVFVAFMVLGAIVNYGTYVLVVEFGPAHDLTPYAGVAAGSLAGLAINFTTSKLFVFRTPG